MSEPYVGEIRMVGFSFAPPGWLACNGQLVSISDYEVLYNLVGITYGGDGQSTFALPNLQSRVSIHQGSEPTGGNYTQGATGGLEAVTLTANTLGSHTHSFLASSGSGTTTSPTGAYPAVSAGPNPYVNDTTNNVVAFATNGIAAVSAGGAHNNLMPYQCINFIIATEGIYPSRS